MGSDVALANAVGREIIAAGLANRAFIERATTGFEAYRDCVETYTLDYAERTTGVPAEAIRDLAHAYARADRAQLCWTLGITEHHNAVDNVLALINLALLTGHVGRYGSGLNPLRGQNNVQGGGDMGAIPNRLPGGQDVEDPHVRARFERVYGRTIPPERGWHLSQMFEAMEHGLLRTVIRHRREPGPVGGRYDPGDPADGGAGPPRRSGHVPDADGRDGPRRAAGLRLLVRVGGDGDQQRAARAARPEGARATGPGEG